MSNGRTTTVGLLLLTAANLFQAIGTYAADCNETHIYNRHWPPHAKFHNAQTMCDFRGHFNAGEIGGMVGYFLVLPVCRRVVDGTDTGPIAHGSTTARSPASA